MTSKALYLGQLRVESIHSKSGEIIITDAPIDNNGKGEAFSPTDLVATSLASCMLTIMGIVAVKNALDISGATAKIQKIMSSNPRRISKIEILIEMPVINITSELELTLEQAAINCPVAKSIHPDIEQKISFEWH
ncbi:MAG: OsmC family protein [Saprospiraceae bacterium]|nr:OsmC family protein [Saprospiraceae bacterium]